MLRHAVILALLATPQAALARPTSTASKPADIVVNSASVPVCTHVRKKAFRPAEGWSVKTVALACKTVTAVIRQPGNKIFTGLEPNKSGKAK
ncbi:hypothetical protein [Methylobacterium longum]|uniref:Uncharacterized protein n=1 Tax=Methylobacterium longum TaxID=767694 RepID=A0ABT8AM46_9HYPH|nr:hypothetical protein [Methylobacterium longum]MDN3570515.1 hypothetical protein [Methylobacterium longum]